MTRLVLLILIIASTFSLKGQIKVVNFNPDIIICTDSVPYDTSGGILTIDTSITFDIDSNGIDDLKFNFLVTGSGMFYHHQFYSITVSPLNDNKIAVSPQNKIFTEAIDSINYDTTGYRWSDSTSMLVGYNYDHTILLDTIYGQWIDVSNKYVSIQLINATDTIISFMKMDCGHGYSAMIPYFYFCTVFQEYEYHPNTISVPEILTNNNVNIFPNPTSGAIHIKSPYILNGIDLFAIDGRLIRSGIRSNEIDLKDFVSSPGIYLLKIYNRSSVMYKKLVLK